jgi:hypothetical protein
MPSAEYWAGFFDGEGSVVITRTGQVRLMIAQKKHEILYLLIPEFGGSITYNKLTKVHQWGICNTDAIRKFVTHVRPYLSVKAEDVDIAVECCGLIRTKNLGCSRIPKEQFEKRLELRNKLLSIRNPRSAKDWTWDEHRVSVKERALVDYKNNNTKRKAYAAEYRESHREKLAKYREDNREKLREAAIKHYWKVRNKELTELGSICSGCGTDLSSFSTEDRRVKEGKIYCRPCHWKTLEYTPKVYTEEQLKARKAKDDRLYRERHRDKTRNRQHEYYEANKERIKAYAKDWYRRRKELQPTGGGTLTRGAASING